LAADNYILQQYNNVQPFFHEPLSHWHHPGRRHLGCCTPLVAGPYTNYPPRWPFLPSPLGHQQGPDLQWR
jgi:hypothetical protein